MESRCNMVVNFLDEKILDLIDKLSDEAIEELLLYIQEKRDIKPHSFLNLNNVRKILSEDAGVLEKLAK